MIAPLTPYFVAGCVLSLQLLAFWLLG